MLRVQPAYKQPRYRCRQVGLIRSSDNKFYRPKPTFVRLLISLSPSFLLALFSRRLHQLPQLPLRVGSDHISPASDPVRDLGIYIDSDVSMRSHVAKTVSACYSVLRQLRTIRRSVSRSVLQSLVSSLVLSRLDYGNSTLAGVMTPAFHHIACHGCSQ